MAALVDDLAARERQVLIWDYYKPRHTHAWNMLMLSWRELDQSEGGAGFEIEYLWENFIIRLWLYRTTVKTLTRLASVEDDAKKVLKAFDGAFHQNGRNSLKALRDVIEHFDEYAAGIGRGPAKRESDLDPWRQIARDRYERGQFSLERTKSYEAATKLHSDAKRVSNKFIRWYKSDRPS